MQQAKAQELHREDVRNAQQQRMGNEALQQLQPIQRVNLPADNAQNPISRHAQPENSAKRPPKDPFIAKFEEKKREGERM